MELDAVHQGVVVDRSSVRRAPAHRLAIALTSGRDVLLREGRKGQHLDAVDLDHGARRSVAPALTHLPPGTEAHRHGDLTAGDTRTEVGTELHHPTVGRQG